MKQLTAILLIAASLFIFSCTNNAKAPEVDQLAKEVGTAAKQTENELYDDTKYRADSTRTPGVPGQQDDKKKQPSVVQSPKQDWEKKIIKTASVNLEVKDYASFYSSLREKVKNLGGYIAQEEQSQSDYKIENTMVIKVPVDQFDNAVVQLTDKVEKINERKITSQDVTTEVVDTKSRMEAKKQVRQRYMDLLNQAKNMTDILNVQSEINGIQEEIESAAGRIEYLGHSSAFSTINLTYYQVLNSSAKEKDLAKENSFGVKLKDAFRTGWEIVSNFFIVIVTIWPLLLASFFAYVLFRHFRAEKPKKVSQ